MRLEPSRTKVRGESKGHLNSASQFSIIITARENMSAWLYILRLKSGQLYIGSTTDLDRRIEEHYSRHACRTTKLDPPTDLLYSEEFDSFSEAHRREKQIKRWSRAKKEVLVSGDMAKLRDLAKPRKGR